MACEVEAFQHVLDLALLICLGHFYPTQGESNVIFYRRHDNLILCIREDEADFPAHLFAVFLHVKAVHCDGSGGGRTQAVDQADQGGLSAAVGADDTNALFGEFKRNVVENVSLVECYRDMVKNNA